MDRDVAHTLPTPSYRLLLTREAIDTSHENGFVFQNLIHLESQKLRRNNTRAPYTPRAALGTLVARSAGGFLKEFLQKESALTPGQSGTPRRPGCIVSILREESEPPRVRSDPA
jgi:hypothetical protein